MIPERLKQAKSFGCEIVDLKKDATLEQQIEQILGVPEVDCAVDCVGFEARGHGHDASVEKPATVLNSIMTVTRAGGALGIPGLYVTGDPGGVDTSPGTPAASTPTPRPAPSPSASAWAGRRATASPPASAR
jgi:glutathione-independent formaldehyde dehydrogenase